MVGKKAREDEQAGKQSLYQRSKLARKTKHAQRKMQASRLLITKPLKEAVDHSRPFECYPKGHFWGRSVVLGATWVYFANN